MKRLILLAVLLAGCECEEVKKNYPIATSEKIMDVQGHWAGSQYFAIYKIEIEGKTYLMTYVHSGICIGPEIITKVEKEKE